MSVRTVATESVDRGMRRDTGALCVVYIAGCGRSGSTFLDVLLGSHRSMVSVGELAKHIANGWSAGRSCSCGAPTERCEYWTEVRRLWTERIGGAAATAYPRLERRFTRVRGWPVLLRARSRPSPAFRDYVHATCALYESVAHTSGQRIIIDSSKLPIRAFALTLMRAIDVRVIQLVRDPRGVAWSHIRRARQRAGGTKGGDATPRVIAEWLSRNIQAGFVRRGLSAEATMLLRYEDLIRKPTETLERIGRLIGCDMADVCTGLQAGRAIEVGHVAAGNRLRLERGLKLRPDVEWMSNLPARDARLIRTLCAPALRKYGYVA